MSNAAYWNGEDFSDDCPYVVHSPQFYKEVLWSSTTWWKQMWMYHSKFKKCSFLDELKYVFQVTVLVSWNTLGMEFLRNSRVYLIFLRNVKPESERCILAVTQLKSMALYQCKMYVRIESCSWYVLCAQTEEWEEGNTFILPKGRIPCENVGYYCKELRVAVIVLRDTFWLHYPKYERVQ